MFSDCNATRREAVKSVNPEVVRFDIVKAKNQFQVMPSLRHLYQAEVLVPSPIPPHLIVFPDSALRFLWSTPNVGLSVVKKTRFLAVYTRTLWAYADTRTRLCTQTSEPAVQCHPDTRTCMCKWTEEPVYVRQLHKNLLRATNLLKKARRYWLQWS